MLRPCLICGTPAKGSRCAKHALPPRGAAHRRARKQVLAGATVCAECGQPPTPDNPLTLGHVVARAHGGGLEPSNTQAECKRCNLSKGVGMGAGGVAAGSHLGPSDPRIPVATRTPTNVRPGEIELRGELS